jgi:hypothetical protein
MVARLAVGPVLFTRRQIVSHYCKPEWRQLHDHEDSPRNLRLWIEI